MSSGTVLKICVLIAATLIIVLPVLGLVYFRVVHRLRNLTDITFLATRKKLLGYYNEWRLRRLLRRSAAVVDDGSLLVEPDDIELADLGEGGIRVVRKDDADGLMTVREDDGTEFVMRAPLARPVFER
ncbi:hypothetical protein MMC14_006467 [Varicellaria rhodocarpa]|nr:hypothetical protein [Varicellaria rhodocarpa]